MAQSGHGCALTRVRQLPTRFVPRSLSALPAHAQHDSAEAVRLRSWPLAGALTEVRTRLHPDEKAAIPGNPQLLVTAAPPFWAALPRGMLWVISLVLSFVVLVQRSLWADTNGKQGRNAHECLASGRVHAHRGSATRLLARIRQSLHMVDAVTALRGGHPEKSHFALMEALEANRICRMPVPLGTRLLHEDLKQLYALHIRSCEQAEEGMPSFAKLVQVRGRSPCRCPYLQAMLSDRDVLPLQPHVEKANRRRLCALFYACWALCVASGTAAFET